jgi:hypothetical protein
MRKWPDDMKQDNMCEQLCLSNTRNLADVVENM